MYFCSTTNIGNTCLRLNPAPSAINTTCLVSFPGFHSNIQCAVICLEVVVSQTELVTETIHAQSAEDKSSILILANSMKTVCGAKVLQCGITRPTGKHPHLLRYEPKPLSSIYVRPSCARSRIEDQDIQDDAEPNTEAEEWLCTRSPYHGIVSVSTFQVLLKSFADLRITNSD